MRAFVIASTLLGLGGLLPVLALPATDESVSAAMANRDAAKADADTALLRRNINTCNPGTCTMVNHSRLSCSCISSTSPGGSPNYRTTTINLDACFANRNGDLVPQNGGSFSRTCTNARIYGGRSIGGLFLEARCYNPQAGEDDFAVVSLGSAVSNSNGVLTCFGRRGT